LKYYVRLDARYDIVKFCSEAQKLADLSSRIAKMSLSSLTPVTVTKAGYIEIKQKLRRF